GSRASIPRATSATTVLTSPGIGTPGGIRTPDPQTGTSAALSDSYGRRCSKPKCRGAGAALNRAPHYRNPYPNGMLDGMTTEQIAVRLPGELLAQLDELVARGVFESRASAVRAGIEAITAADRRRVIDRALLDGYRRIPPTQPDEVAAVASLREAIAEEPW
ncbi:MAG: hypothetical protein QOI86_56, partial [Actinomycetota bacterium]|nr:hypothetical protein [Actinomycetota bacterium]